MDALRASCEQCRSQATHLEKLASPHDAVIERLAAIRDEQVNDVLQSLPRCSIRVGPDIGNVPAIVSRVRIEEFLTSLYWQSIKRLKAVCNSLFWA